MGVLRSSTGFHCLVGSTVRFQVGKVRLRDTKVWLRSRARRRRHRAFRALPRQPGPLPVPASKATAVLPPGSRTAGQGEGLPGRGVMSHDLASAAALGRVSPLP